MKANNLTRAGALLAVPSLVSSSPKLRDECHKGAKFVAKMLEGLGADVKVVQVYEDKNPVIIGRLGHNPDRPTVTFYGHYDVQPAAEPDWATNPFELNSVNEYLYGRGVSDNKHCLQPPPVR
ncbi:Beta-Ala-His dipeptidase [Tetrabaena socialis]|uniref:Beta-Ala-His dipeptidase n=1 Tax=Tetrabaena socialis TaxID=47790 RepID=A0A2J8AEF6_9CHLO|nr:Beta-Ala-His dipeptidase [Tetrabaena socialis]|eukprot:PNH10889.1 Beta-Ala-His dipeptidase [Tetrabaena socialis]